MIYDIRSQRHIVNKLIRGLQVFIVAGIWGLPVLAGDNFPAGVHGVDDSGNRIELAAPANRIVSLAPHATELLFSAGAGEKIAGTVAHSDYPAAAKVLPRVGDASNLDLERILQLDPDLIVAWQSGLQASQLARLRGLGIPVFLSQPKTLDAIAAGIENLGSLTGTSEQANVIAASFRKELTRLRQTFAGNTAHRVFYQIWGQPLMTVNGEHLISQVINLCGGHNVFSELPPLVPSVSREAVLKENPDVILVSAAAGNQEQGPGHWEQWQSLAAVRNNRVHYVPWSEISRPTVRMLKAIDHVCTALQ